MKKLLLSLSLAAGLSFAAQAQTTSFGIKAGATLSKFNNNNDLTTDYRVGFQGGVTFNVGLTKNFSIQPELLYSQIGAKTTVSSVDFKQKLQYIDLPLMLRLHSANGFFVEAGPQFSYLVDGRKSANGASDLNSSSFATHELGYAGGIGYQMPAGVGIGARYSASFTDINKNSIGYIQHNSVFQLYLSYVILGGK